MQTIRQLLAGKQVDVYSVTPEAAVIEAIALMADKGIGAVLVMRGAQLAGILSERDYARKVVLRGRASGSTRVEEIMTPQVLTVTPAQTVEQCMQLMTDHRIRHLPVLEAGQVVGVVSIGDLVKSVIEQQRQDIDHLQRYIAG